MQKTIITTVGTSLITNYHDKKGNTKSEKEYKLLKGKPFFGNSSEDITDFLERIKPIKNGIVSYVNEDGSCAEISSIFAIAEQLAKTINNKSEKLELTLFFVCTDTILSPLCAEVIATYLNEKKNTYTVKNGKNIDITVNIEITTKEFILQKDDQGKYSNIIDNIKNQVYNNEYIIKGLTVNDNTDFQNTGFEGLSSIITKLVTENKSKNPIINITGGYKGFIPVLTLICQLLEVDMQYLYEESKAIITIPKLPIQFDLAVIESIASYLDNNYLKTIDSNSALYRFLVHYHLITGNNELSGIGRILHNHLFNGQIGLSNSILGSFVEFKLFHYFSACNYTKYHSPIKNEEADYYAYKVTNDAYGFSEKQGSKPDDKKLKEIGFTFKLGDIDLVLKNEINQDAICEIKAHNTFSEGYIRDLNDPKKPKDYYDKVRARIEFWKHTRKVLPNEYLFIVYKIRILQGDKSEFLTDNAKSMIKHFADKIKHNYNGEVNFKVLGLWVDLKDFEINYSKLLQEELKDENWLINLEQNNSN